MIENAIRPLGSLDLGAGRSQDSRIPTPRPVSPQMMVSSHLKNSRITLLMGFSAQRSCGNCSATSMDISPSEYNRSSDLLWQCLARLFQPTVSPAVMALSGGQEGWGKRRQGPMPTLSTHLHLLQLQPCCYTASSWDPRITRLESPPVLNPSIPMQRMSEDSWALLPPPVDVGAGIHIFPRAHIYTSDSSGYSFPASLLGDTRQEHAQLPFPSPPPPP